MFILTDKKHNNGLLLNEYNAELGLTYCIVVKDEVKPFWVYRQSIHRFTPVSKPMPHRVPLGTPSQARAILKALLEEVESVYFPDKKESEIDEKQISNDS